LYRIDKKLLAIERDIENIKNGIDKKNMMEIIKKKSTTSKSDKHTPIIIHSSLYKVNRNKMKIDIE
jgi:hypothetical protein